LLFDDELVSGAVALDGRVLL
jgi:hypothetical protein